MPVDAYHEAFCGDGPPFTVSCEELVARYPSFAASGGSLRHVTAVDGPAATYNLRLDGARAVKAAIDAAPPGHAFAITSHQSYPLFLLDCILDVLPPTHYDVRVVVLRRYTPAVMASYQRRWTFARVDTFASFVAHTARAAFSLVDAVGTSPNDGLVGYLFDVEASAGFLRAHYPGVAVVDARAEDLQDHHGALSLFQSLGLLGVVGAALPPHAIAALVDVIGVRANQDAGGGYAADVLAANVGVVEDYMARAAAAGVWLPPLPGMTPRGRLPSGTVTLADVDAPVQVRRPVEIQLHVGGVHVTTVPRCSTPSDCTTHTPVAADDEGCRCKDPMAYRLVFRLLGVPFGEARAPSIAHTLWWVQFVELRVDDVYTVAEAPGGGSIVQLAATTTPGDHAAGVAKGWTRLGDASPEHLQLVCSAALGEDRANVTSPQALANPGPPHACNLQPWSRQCEVDIVLADTSCVPMLVVCAQLVTAPVLPHSATGGGSSVTHYDLASATAVPHRGVSVARLVPGATRCEALQWEAWP